MKNILKAIEDCLNDKNWHAALFITITVPDICGSMEFPGEGSRARYRNWFDKYVAPSYTTEVGPNRTKEVFLCGDDCFALRCAMLHEGSLDISTSRAAQLLESFQFVVPPPGAIIHNNLLGNQLQLQVDEFCQDVIRGARQWLEDIKDDEEKANSANSLLPINLHKPGSDFIIKR